MIGAGGGGFFLVCVNNKKKICKILDEDRVNYIDFDIEKNGSKVLIASIASSIESSCVLFWGLVTVIF